MRNIAIANGIALSKLAGIQFLGGKSALELAAEYGRDLPGVEEVHLLSTGTSSIPGYTCHQRSQWTLPELLRVMQELAGSCDNIFYFYADCPFLDITLAEGMLKNHQQYYADYTFADGYPYGLSPEILRPKLLQSLIALVSNTPEAEQDIQRESIFELIKKDINAFDIETEISPVDLRMLRLTLAADSSRNVLLLKRIAQALGPAATAPIPAKKICDILQEKGEILRTLPAYFSIQVIEGCPQRCSYCPYPVFAIKDTGKKGEMPLSRFKQLIDKIETFCHDAVVSISLWGEPAYHSQIVELAGTVLEREGLRLIIETSGVGWDPAHLSGIAQGCPRAPDWVVSLDADTEETYRSLRGDQFREAQGSLELLLSLFPGHVYPQAVRMKSNEEELEAFYRRWKEKAGPVIIQKYDHFAGFLPERKVTDLSPLKRFPCWHLKRDLYIYLDGRVPLCREDVEGRHLLGNAFEQDLEEIWSRGEGYYLAHLGREYPQICQNCDEYYTFNF